MSIRTIIVDGHTIVGEGLSRSLASEEEIEVVNATPAEAREAVVLHQPEVVIIDLLDLADSTWPLFPKIYGPDEWPKLLIVSDRVRPQDLFEAVAIGASGFWTYKEPFGLFVDAVRQVARGGWGFSPAVFPYISITPAGPRAFPLQDYDEDGQLTQRQMEVLVLLANGLSVKECAKRMRISHVTVENHKRRLMQKLDVHKLIFPIWVSLNRFQTPTNCHHKLPPPSMSSN